MNTKKDKAVQTNNTHQKRNELQIKLAKSAFQNNFINQIFGIPICVDLKVAYLATLLSEGKGSSSHKDRLNSIGYENQFVCHYGNFQPFLIANSILQCLFDTISNGLDARQFGITMHRLKIYIKHKKSRNSDCPIKYN